MLIRTLRAERMKLRRSPVWLAFVLLPLLSAFFGTFNYLQNQGILQKGWYDLWTQQTLFLCFFFQPALIGVYCAYLYRLEHMNRNWNAVMTVPVPVTLLYLAKLASAFLMVLLTQAWSGLLIFVSGKLCGLSSPMPAEFYSYLAYGALGGLAVCAVQLFLSLFIRSFAVPVGISLIGGVASMFTMSKGYGLLWPYALADIGMRANNPEGALPCTPEQLIASCVLFLLLFAALSVLFLKKRDVQA